MSENLSEELMELVSRAYDKTLACKNNESLKIAQEVRNRAREGRLVDPDIHF